MSRPVKDRLRQLREHHISLRVLAVFEHACDLVIPDDDGGTIRQVGRSATCGCVSERASHLNVHVIALVTSKVGDGPLNIVLEDAPDPFAGIPAGAPVRVKQEQVEVRELRVRLTGATVWDPRPDWSTLRARRAATASRLPVLRDACLRRGPADTTAVRGGPADSLLALLRRPWPEWSEGTIQGAVLSRAARAAQALGEGWAGEGERLQAGATGLAGLGGGLTPSGDDFLVGAMLGAWLTHPTPEPLCRVLVEAAAPRTTTLSAAFLHAAARGECSAAWHTLLAALSCRPDRADADIADADIADADIADADIRGKTCHVSAAARGVMTHGATSGADALAGFLFVCQRLTGQCQTLRVSGRETHSEDRKNETHLSGL